MEAGPPKVDGLPKPASSISTSSTFGAPSGGDGVMLIVQSATEASIVRPIVPPKFGSGMGSTVRSGLNLPIASASDSFNAPMPCLSPWTTDLIAAPESVCSTPSSSVVVEYRDDSGGPGRQVLADLVVDIQLDSVVDELAHHAARHGADCNRREQRWREQADRQSDAAAPTDPLAATPITGLPYGDRSILSMCDQDDTIDSDIPVLDSCNERVEVLGRRLDILVAGDENVGRCFSHHRSPSAPCAVPLHGCTGRFERTEAALRRFHPMRMNPAPAGGVTLKQREIRGHFEEANPNGPESSGD